MTRKWMAPLLAICLATLLCAQAPWIPQEERGRQIYENGTSGSGEAITASLAGDAQISGSIVPCANCHGLDGKGKPESGIFPSNITWDVLTRPYRLTNANGRSRPAYNERLLKRAFTMGIDSDGNSLNEAMPRFHMSQSDAADLVAYLRRLNYTPEPGLNSTTIRIGIVLPTAGGDSRLAEMTRQALDDAVRVVNEGGGIFGRRIDPVFMDAPTDLSQRAADIRSFVARQQVFAVIADMTGAESGLAAALADLKVPAIAMYAPFPAEDASHNRYVFYLDAGLEGELRALVRFAAQEFRGSEEGAIIVASSDAVSRDAAGRLAAMLRASGRPARTVTHLESNALPAVIFWLGAGVGSPEISEARHSAVLVPAMLLGSSNEVAAGHMAGAYVAIENESWQGQIAGQPRWVWARATTAATLLVEALKESGQNLTREDLIAALERFKDAQSALPEPITFGPNRRIGTEEVWIMKLDSSGHELAVSKDGEDAGK